MKLSRSASAAARCGHMNRSAIISLSLLLLGQIALIESQPALNVTVSSTQAPVSTTTTTTSAPTTTTTAQPSTTTNTQQVSAAAAPTTTQATTTPAAAATAVPSTTMREPSEQEIQEARKLIHEIASTLKDNPNGTRMILNRPTILSQNQDFAPDSPEAKIADATSQFGLEFIKNLPSSTPQSARQNVVISPVSMQILLNIILLGTKDQSATQLELMEVLGYSGPDQQANNNTSTTATNEQTRLKPHAAMHSLLEHISRATHLTVEDHQQQQLLNVNGQLAAHLQTSVREGEVPLSGQVNFTLANLMLTNSDLAKTSAQYETDLTSFYDIKLERFSRLSEKSNATPSSAPKKNETTAPTIQLHERVNRWVQNITQGQIGSLVEEADLAGGDLAMVLLNAAHFKGRWLHTFNTKLTQERVFYNEGQEMGAKEVKFMRQNGVFGYGEFGTTSERSSANGGHHPHTSSSSDQETLLTEDLVTLTPTSSTTAAPATSEKQQQQQVGPATTPANDEEQQQNAAEARRYELTAKLNCSALMLPFSLNDGQELSMIVLLPNKRDGLQDLVNNLNGQALNEIYRSLSEQQVQVELPKFSFESSHDARATLLKMGLSKIFKDGAELDRMFAESGAGGGGATQVMPPVKVDKVIHKAKIAVDEMGAEAAAASAATIVLRNLIRPPNPSFVADHPFLFVIRHNRSNLPLFMGRIERL